MAGKVVSIQRKKPDEQVLALCKRLLELAESGELMAVAVAFETANEGTDDDYAFAVGSQPVSLVGQLDLMSDAVKSACRELEVHK